MSSGVCHGGEPADGGADAPSQGPGVCTAARTRHDASVPTAFRIEGVRRDVERLPDAPADPDAFYGALLTVLDAHGLPFAGACWHLTDPVTGLFTWTGATGALPGDFVTALENEYLEDDVAKYSELAVRRSHASALVVDT